MLGKAAQAVFGQSAQKPRGRPSIAGELTELAGEDQTYGPMV
jgi:hypothetical protein